jgi:hypothetical protein
MSPTAKRYFAAIITHARADGPIGVPDLPQEQDFDFAQLIGGFAVIHEKGVLLFDDWQTEPLSVDALKDEIERTFRLLGEVRWVGSQLDGIVQEGSGTSDPAKPRPLMAVLSDLSALSMLRGRLARAKHQCGPKSEKEDVRRFRQRLEAWWGIEQAVDELYERVSEIEDAYRTASMLRTQGLVSILAIYGLPFFISSAITGFLSDPIKRAAGGWAPVWLVVVYVGLAAALIAMVRLLQRRLLGRSVRHWH